MAIPKISSKEYNIAFLQSVNSIDRVEERVNTIKADLEKKISIINYENNLLKKLNFSNESKKQDNSQSTSSSQILVDCRYGEFERYGLTAYPKLTSKPVNLFNLEALNAKEIAFRRDVEASIEEVATGEITYCTDILKHSSLEDKEISFFEFNSNEIRLKIKKTTAMLGYFSGNLIEINPFLTGSFDINRITFLKESSPVYYHTNIMSVKREVILIDKKIDFDEIEIDITLNHRDGKYLFGLKHLYILDASFTQNSFCISKINNSDNILRVLDSCSYTMYGRREFGKLSEMGVEIYADEGFRNQILIGSEISRNIKSFYIKIPLFNRGSFLALQSFTVNYGVRNAGTLFDDPTDTTPPDIVDEEDDNKWTIDDLRIVTSDYEFNIFNNKGIDVTNIGESNIYIMDEDNKHIDTILNLSSDRRTLRIKATSPFSENKRYSIYIKDLKTPEGDVIYEYTIIPFYADNRQTSLSLDVDTDYRFYLTSEEEIDQDSLDNIVITDKLYIKLESKIELTEDKKKVYINPLKGYESNNTYAIYIDNLKDINGIILKDGYKVVLNTIKD